MTEWEAEIKVRRNGRLAKWEKALGSDPDKALYAVWSDVVRWAQDYPASQSEEG